MSHTDEQLVEVRPVRGTESDYEAVARAAIPEGAVLGAFDGIAQWVELDKNGKIEHDHLQHKHFWQLAKVGNRLLVLRPGDEFSGVDFINHSCQPNTRIERGIVIIALRDIARGEPLTFDYRKEDIVLEGIRCWCPSHGCTI